MCNSYCKNDYGKSEVDVVKIIQIRPQNMKRNVTMTCFHCLVSKKWKKNSILCYYKKKNNTRFVLFLKRTKVT